MAAKIEWLTVKGKQCYNYALGEWFFGYQANAKNFRSVVPHGNVKVIFPHL